MVKTWKKIILGCFILLQLFLLIFSLRVFIPQNELYYSNAYLCLVFIVALFFCTVTALTNNKYYQIEYYLKDRNLERNETLFLYEFMNEMRECYSYEDFYSVIEEIIEVKANCSVLYMNCKKNSVLYHSPNRIASLAKVKETIENNYPLSWAEGFFYISSDLSMTSSASNARGFFFSYKEFHFFVFCNYTHLFKEEIFSQLFEEFCRFQNRMETMNQLTEMMRVSHQWNHLVDIQKFYMEKSLPKLTNLDMSFHYKFDVDNNGTFFKVQNLSESKTFVLFGEAFTKGLTSVLISSLILNINEIIRSKTNLLNVLEQINKTLDDSNLENKNTALFLRIIDSVQHTINYINIGIQCAEIFDYEKRNVYNLHSSFNFINKNICKTVMPVAVKFEQKNVLFLSSNVNSNKELIGTAFSNSNETSKKMIENTAHYFEKKFASKIELTLLSIKS